MLWPSHLCFTRPPDPDAEHLDINADGDALQFVLDWMQSKGDRDEDLEQQAMDITQDIDTMPFNDEGLFDNMDGYSGFGASTFAPNLTVYPTPPDVVMTQVTLGMSSADGFAATPAANSRAHPDARQPLSSLDAAVSEPTTAAGIGTGFYDEDLFDEMPGGALDAGMDGVEPNWDFFDKPDINADAQEKMDTASSGGHVTVLLPKGDPGESIANYHQPLSHGTEAEASKDLMETSSPSVEANHDNPMDIGLVKKEKDSPVKFSSQNINASHTITATDQAPLHRRPTASNFIDHTLLISSFDGKYSRNGEFWFDATSTSQNRPAFPDGSAWIHRAPSTSSLSTSNSNSTNGDPIVEPEYDAQSPSTLRTSNKPAWHNYEPPVERTYVTEGKIDESAVEVEIKGVLDLLKTGLNTPFLEEVFKATRSQNAQIGLPAELALMFPHLFVDQYSQASLIHSSYAPDKAVYGRIPPDSAAFPGTCNYPLILADSGGIANIKFTMDSSVKSPISERNDVLHLAYALSEDLRWLTAAWTDVYGRKALTMTYQLRAKTMSKGRPKEEILRELWEVSRDLMKNQRTGWRLVVARIGFYDTVDLNGWTRLLNGEIKASACELCLFAIEVHPSLKLGAPELEAKIGQGSNQNQQALYGTPASTPQAANATSPDNLVPATPTPSNTSALNAPTPPEHAFDTSIDGDLSLVDPVEESWAVILPFGINQSHSILDIRRAPASGYLIKRTNPRDEDGTTIMGSVIRGKESPGVARVEAISSVITLTDRVFIFFGVFLVAYVYQPTATASFSQHSLLATVNVLRAVIAAAAQPTTAKLADVFGRVELVCLSLLFYIVGTIVEATAYGVNAFCAGAVIYQIGYTMIIFLLEVVIADITSTRARLLFSYIPALPFIINTWVSGDISSATLKRTSWHWGVGMWAIIYPVTALPLIISLFVVSRRAKKQRLLAAYKTPYEQHGFKALSVDLFWQLDAIGIILLIAVFALILTPLTIASGLSNKWKQAHVIAPLVVGILCIPVFVAWEFRSPHPLAPFSLMKDRGVWGPLGIALFLNFAWGMQADYLYTVLIVAFDFSIAGATRIVSLYSFTSTITGFLLGFVVYLVRRLKVFIVVGTCIYMVAFGLLIHYRGDHTNSAQAGVIGAEVLLGFAGGMFPYPAQASLQVSLKHEHLALMTGLYLATYNIGSALGNTVSGSVWTNTLYGKLEKHLAFQSNTTLAAATYADPFTIAKEYPVGTPEREAIIQSYQSVQKLLCIIGICLCVPLLAFAIVLRNPKLNDDQTLNKSRGEDEQ
ncbi:hypothetical protein DV737_g2179, partial [Chaetothyriales sp. CBS 132003]